MITVTATYEGGAPISDTITIVRDALTYLLPEGSTGTFFTTDVLIANPNNTEVEADVRFLKSSGESVSMPLQILRAEAARHHSDQHRARPRERRVRCRRW